MTKPAYPIICHAFFGSGGLKDKGVQYPKSRRARDGEGWGGGGG